MTLPLNQGQTEAAEGFLSFLMSDDPELIISGPGGVGKTHLMSAMIDQIMPRYFELCGLMGTEPKYDSVYMTATTNKAAEVLSVATQRPTSTLASLLNLKVQEDYSTGATKLSRTGAWKVHEGKIIFVDECSMIDTPLRQALHEGTHNCKIVYVGDHCQLAPVMEPTSPIYRDNLPFFELTEQMRTNVPELQALNDQLRHTVETGEFYPIQTVPGIIDYLDDNQMQEKLFETFQVQNAASRILSYTNGRVNEYNNHIREIRHLPEHFTEGESVISCGAIRLKKYMLSVEEEVLLVSMADRTTMVDIAPGVQLEVCFSTILPKRGIVPIENVPIPMDRDHYHALIKYYQKKKEWHTYFKLKGEFPDLRPRDACTLHKSQGSTYDSVFIDLGNISTCHNADQVARMLYVGASRAKSNVYFYGNLAPKYGSIIQGI